MAQLANKDALVQGCRGALEQENSVLAGFADVGAGEICYSSTVNTDLSALTRPYKLKKRSFELPQSPVPSPSSLRSWLQN